MFILYALLGIIPMAMGALIFLNMGGPQLGSMKGWIAVAGFFAYLFVLDKVTDRR